MKKKIIVYFCLFAAWFLGLLGIVGIGVYFLLSGSLLELDGEVLVPEMENEVQVTFDEYGVPTISAGNSMDAVRALGFLHSSERLYGMDLQRRLAAGELSELVGEGLFWMDQINRVYDFRKRAQSDYESLPKHEKRMLIAYCEGVNAGIDTMSVRPWEFLVLDEEIKRWKPEDCLLVGYSIYLDLQARTIWNEKCRFVMKENLPEDVYTFFESNGSDWEAAMDGSKLPLLPIPPESSFSYLSKSDKAARVAASRLHVYSSAEYSEGRVSGSNAWAISGKHTKSGAAMLANDIHLQLSVPNIWYRANLKYRKADKDANVYGATLPGLPLVVIGSNESVAWGFTNSLVDTVDLIEIESDPIDENRYLTTTGSEAYERREYSIKVKGGGEKTVSYLHTRWGPVVENIMGRNLALRWSAFEGVGINLKLNEFESVETVEEALNIAPHIAMPTVNLFLADKAGNIAWTLAGPVMIRANYDGDSPIKTSTMNPAWNVLEAASYPKILNPESGYVWNANDRALGSDLYSKIGYPDALTAARSHQISNRLSEMNYPVDESQLLAGQLDIEAPFYFRWRDLLVEVLKNRGSSENIRLNQMLDIVESWNGEASADSTGFLLIRDYRELVSTKLYERLLSVCYGGYDYFSPTSFRLEDPLWQIVSQRPDYLRSKRFDDWESELVSYATEQLNRYESRYGADFRIEELNWGDVNKLNITHPMSAVIPFIGRFTDMEKLPVSGDVYVTKVVGGNFGASERMVVSPGFEESAIFQMPGGQSGHPLSEFYTKGFEEWLSGNPSPLASRKVTHTLIFRSN